MQPHPKRAWIVAAIVVAGGSFAACDVRIDVLDASDAAVTGGGGAPACDVSTDGTRAGDAREVRDMTHDEATAWCQNYIDNVYATRADGSAPGTQSNLPGYVIGSVAYCWTVGGCVVGAECRGLRREPPPRAVRGDHHPVEHVHRQFHRRPETGCGAGCEAFMNAPHCSETVISKIGPPVADGAGGGDECYLRTSKGCR